jgi:hypothetical protein
VVRKPYANRKPVCDLENYKWYGETYFVGAAIPIYIYIYACCKFRGGETINRYGVNECFVEG